MKPGDRVRKCVLYLTDGSHELRTGRRCRFELVTVATLHEALACLRSMRIDIVVVEYSLPWHIGVALLEDLSHRRPGHLRVLTGTERWDEDVARVVSIGTAHQYVPRAELARALIDEDT